MNLALFTTIYPGSEQYFDDFCGSLLLLDYKDFDLVIVNDGVDCRYLESFRRFRTTILNGVKSISKNRELGINYIIMEKYDYVFLCDIDDLIEPSRISLCLKYFENTEADIVVNDLNIIGQNKQLLIKEYFKKSINETTKIDLEFILNKNILGFSNTALKCKKLKLCTLPYDLKIVDWYWFTLLIKQDLQVRFLSKALTLYRQHSNNLIGINNFSEKLFVKMLALKEMHFLYLTKVDDFFEPYFQDAKKQNASNIESIRSALLINRTKFPYPLWWENIFI